MAGNHRRSQPIVGAIRHVPLKYITGDLEPSFMASSV